MRLYHAIILLIPVVALFWWAYHENYATRNAKDRIEELQVQIGQKRDTLARLKAEWAYLNRPERLAELVDIYFNELQLVPMTHERFGSGGDIPFRNEGRAIFDPESSLLLAAPGLEVLDR